MMGCDIHKSYISLSANMVKLINIHAMLICLNINYFSTASYSCRAGGPNTHFITFEIDDLGNIGPPSPMFAAATLPFTVADDPYP